MVPAPTYAAARDTQGLARLSGWQVARGTPRAAIVATAGLALALVGFGAYTRGGFATMVDYLSPVYWLFLTMSGIALLVLRRRYPDVPRPFRVYSVVLLSVGHDPHQTKKATKGRVIVSWDQIP